MFRLTRKFTELIPKDSNKGFLKKLKEKWVNRPVIYRLLLIGSALCAGGSFYFIKHPKRNVGGLENNPTIKYYQPAEILENGVSMKQQQYYIIGVIKEGSLNIYQNTLKHTFILTDFIHEIKIVYDGILPTTCREGETTRVQGEFVNPYNPVEFVASLVEGGHDSERTKTTYQLRSKDITIKQRPI